LPHLIADCPLCRSKKITMDAISKNLSGTGDAEWQLRFQVCCNCRECSRSTLWLMEVNNYQRHSFVQQDSFWKADISLSEAFRIIGYQSLADFAAIRPPEHVPPELVSVFNEAARCSAVGCANASVAMSRLCLDMATKRLLPEPEFDGPQPNREQRNRLYDRLAWLFEQNILQPDLQQLAETIRIHGNDGAHDGTCTADDATDLIEFTSALLERCFTLPARVELAKARAIARRG
jgi:hypothetical protein